jgi:hypothetical protein
MIELAEVLRRHAPEYLRRGGARVPGHHRRALRAIVRCRTPELGGHLYRCGQCARTHFGWHSCHHRSCPKCGGTEAAAWRERQQRDLLPVPYFLVTFTLPEELRALCQSHPRLGYTLLFRESAGTLQEIAANPRHLGAELGFVGVLHTWTRQLGYHPHVHYVVPGGGVRADGQKWRQCRTLKDGTPYLLPVPVLSRRFRTRFAEALRTQAPELHREVPRAVWEKEWVVHSQPAGRGHAAVGYLARYVQNTALGGKALLADEDGRVTFRYTESRTGAPKTLSLDALEFIRRLLSHVLPPGLHKVRYFGWLHPNAKRRFLKVQTLLAVPLRLTPQALPEPPAHLRCPHCGKFTLQLVGRLPRARAP